MASRPRALASAKVDFAALAESMRTAATLIRSQAETRYRDELARADSLETAAGQLRTLVEPAAATTGEFASRPARRRRGNAGGATTRPAGVPGAKTATVSKPSGSASTITDRAIALVAGSPRRTWTAGEVASSLNAEPSSVSTLLARAVTDGKLRRVGRGAYQSPR